jgi:hypothetical protein
MCYQAREDSLIRVCWDISVHTSLFEVFVDDDNLLSDFV